MQIADPLRPEPEFIKDPADAEELDLVHSWCILACKWDDSVQLTAC